ncbi:MAG: hypothetical protein GY757_53050 [bacterium]|nr:hypothetical protein [bacterium]
MTATAKNLLVALISIAIGLYIPGKIVYVRTESINARLLLRFTEFEKSEIKVGSIVETRVKDIYDKSHIITKKVSCTEGMKITTEGREIFCNGISLGVAKTHSRKGVPLKNFRFNGKIPKGKLFISGTHKDSYDSRYWGFKDENEILAICYTVL